MSLRVSAPPGLAAWAARSHFSPHKAVSAEGKLQGSTCQLLARTRKILQRSVIGIIQRGGDAAGRVLNFNFDIYFGNADAQNRVLGLCSPWHTAALILPVSRLCYFVPFCFLA